MLTLANMLVSDVEIFLEKKKKHQYSHERYRKFLENEKRRLL